MKGHDNTPEEFWRRVNKGGDDECWEWIGLRNGLGYGRFSYQNHGWKAHRLAWFFHHGCIPRAMFVCHRCDNPPCVNPTHLFLGTMQDNMTDCKGKGRNRSSFRERPEVIPRGDTHYCAKLTAAKVREIRACAAQGVSLPELGARYGVDGSNIWKIINRKTWKHVDERSATGARE